MIKILDEVSTRERLEALSFRLSERDRVQQPLLLGHCRVESVRTLDTLTLDLALKFLDAHEQPVPRRLPLRLLPLVEPVRERRCERGPQ